MPDTYAFRLKCHLPATRDLAGDTPVEFSIGESGHLVSVSVPKKKDVTETGEVVFCGTKLGNKAEAEDVGKRLKNAVVLASLSVGLGIDVGQDKPGEGAFGFAFYAGDKKVTVTPGPHNKLDGDTIMVDDVHGLIIHPDRKKTFCYSFKISEPVTPVSTKEFVEAIRNFYSLNKPLSGQEKLALELFNASYYGSSSRTRFLTLMSVIEVLAESERLSEDACMLIDRLLYETNNADLVDFEREDLINRLAFLKRESISRACQKLLEQRLGVNAKGALKKYYNVRSKMLHEGKFVEQTDFVDMLRTLEIMVSGLLQAEIFDRKMNLKFKHDKVPGF